MQIGVPEPLSVGNTLSGNISIYKVKNFVVSFLCIACNTLYCLVSIVQKSYCSKFVSSIQLKGLLPFPTNKMKFNKTFLLACFIGNGLNHQFPHLATFWHTGGWGWEGWKIVRNEFSNFIVVPG